MSSAGRTRASHTGYSHYLLLTMLGEALLRTGAASSTPEFEEAQSCSSRL